MTDERRLFFLKIGVAVAVGLWLLNTFVLSPTLKSWKAQSDRTTAIRQKVERGRKLCERETSLRDRWAGMLRANLPAEVSAAEITANRALDRWARTSQILVTGLTPNWQSRDDDFDIYECRLSATGTQAAFSRFIYELETDSSVPVNLEECELATRDARGSQLTLTARITFLRLKEPSK